MHDGGRAIDDDSVCIDAHSRRRVHGGASIHGGASVHGAARVDQARIDGEHRQQRAGECGDHAGCRAKHESPRDGNKDQSAQSAEKRKKHATEAGENSAEDRRPEHGAEEHGHHHEYRAQKVTASDQQQRSAQNEHKRGREAGHGQLLKLLRERIERLGCRSRDDLARGDLARGDLACVHVGRPSCANRSPLISSGKA